MKKCLISISILILICCIISLHIPQHKEIHKIVSTPTIKTVGMGIYNLFYIQPVYAAAIVCSATGLWSATGTWTGGVVPGNGDTVTIGTGKVVTVDVTHDIGTTTVEGGLTLATGVVATASGTLTIGNGASKDGTLTLGAGSDLELGATTLTLNNCFLRSNSTSGSWAKITGTGGVIAKGAAYSYPKQDIILAYVSFQNTGAITFDISGTSGTGETNQLNLDNCVFYGNGAITFGQGSITPLNTPLTVDNCDFVDMTGDITFTGITSDATAAKTITNSTFYNSSANRTIKCNTTRGWVFDKCVFSRVLPNGANTAGNITFQNCFFYWVNGSGGNNMAYFSDQYNASTFNNNYVYSNYANAHQIGGTATAGGTGTHSFLGNVFEVIGNTNTANVITLYRLGKTILNNIVFTDGWLINTTSSAMGGTTDTIKNNTTYVTASDESGLFLIEVGQNTGGTINVSNNIISSSVTQSVSEGFSNISASSQTIDYSDYNAFYNFNTRYDLTNLTVTTGQTHDMTAAPNFLDTSRSLATWNSRVNGGTETAAAGNTYLLGINGYRGTPYFDQGGTVSINLPSNLLEWVRYGYSTTNGLLRKAGDDGSTIGAMEWQNPRRKRAM